MQIALRNHTAGNFLGGVKTKESSFIATAPQNKN
jgi:hypothetical protein